MAQQNTFGYTAADREQAFLTLYKQAFPAVAKYVSKLGGSFDDAKDIFQDALVIYYERSAVNALELKLDEKAYIFGIAKNLWAKKFRENVFLESVENCEMNFAHEEDTQPSAGKLMHYLETAGQKCMEMLKAFYYDNLPVKTVAELFGFSGERSATVQKYKCMEKVRETIKQRSLTYEDFLE